MYLKIVLTKDGKDIVIHDGKLNADIKNKSLGIFEKNEKAILTFTVQMPTELDNQYTLRNGSVKWTFDMVPRPIAVKTGDAFNIAAVAVVALAALAIAAAVCFRRKKGEKEAQ